MRLSVVDTRVVSTTNVVALPLSQVNVGSGDTVMSTLSSAERTGKITATATATTSTATATSRSESRLATPRRLANNNGDSRKRGPEETIPWHPPRSLGVHQTKCIDCKHTSS